MQLDHDSCELLREVVHTLPDGGSCISSHASKVSDWDALIGAASKHGVLAMLYSRLANEGIAIQSATLARIKAEYDRNAFHNLTNAAELLDVLKEFSANGIPAMPFKGVVLGTSVYHDLTTRPAGDLDVLVFYCDLAKATAVLLNRGYELKTPVRDDGSPVIEDYFEYHFERQSDGMVIELRWRLELTQPRFRRDLGMNWIWPRRQTTTLAGAEVPDLDPTIKLMVLCMHGSKHVWSRLIWICDVARLLEAYPDLDWDDVIQEAKRNGLWRSLALGTVLAHRVARAPVLESVLRTFESDMTVHNLARHIGENLFNSPGSTPKSRVPYHVQLLGFPDRIRLFFSLGFLRPNERDRAYIKLPNSLHSLYYLVRPFRMLIDKTAR